MMFLFIASLLKPVSCNNVFYLCCCDDKSSSLERTESLKSFNEKDLFKIIVHWILQCLVGPWIMYFKVRLHELIHNRIILHTITKATHYVSDWHIHWAYCSVKVSPQSSWLVLSLCAIDMVGSESSLSRETHHYLEKSAPELANS